MHQDTIKADVLIVGSGPVGLILANILKRNGLNVIIIDKRISKPNIPRAIAVNQATLDIFETLGLNSIFQSGLVVNNLNLYWKDKYLGQLDFNNTALDHPYFFHISQNVIEKHLENDLDNLGLRVNYGTELISYTQNESLVCAQIRNNGHIFSINTNFLIGCDGDSSTVREIMAGGVDQGEYGPSFVLADVSLKNYNKKDTNYIFTEHGYLMIVPLPAKRYRLIFSVEAHQVLENYDKNSLQQICNERSNIEIKIANVFWATQAKYGHKISKQIVQNRVILAGDALHQFSPVGGTNMNVGIQDAFALGWRLIHANNSSCKTHLDEYATERKEIMQKQLKLTEWITALITRTKNYPAKDEPIKDLQTIKGYLTGLNSGNSQKHLQNFINYHDIKYVVNGIRNEFSKANYVLFTRGTLTEGIAEKIKSRINKRQFLTWIHNPCRDLFKFLFCRPDAIVTSSGGLQDLDELFNAINLGVVNVWTAEAA